MKKRLLFVTCPNCDQDGGLGYAADLARALNEEMTILVIEKTPLRERFEDIMSAVAFAEANEQDAALELVQGSGHGNGIEKEERLLEQCRESGIPATLHRANGDLRTVLTDFLSRGNGVDLILLSPSVMEQKELSSRDLKRLVKTVSRPVVTMARQEVQHA